LLYFIAAIASLDQARVESAMAEISSQTCVRFRRTENRREPQVVWEVKVLQE